MRNKVFLILAFILTEYIHKDSLVDTSEVVRIMFFKNTKWFHTILNKMFSELNLRETFEKDPKIKLLFNIHNSILKIMDKYYKHNEAEIDKTTIKENITDTSVNLLSEILQDNTLFPENCTMKENDHVITKELLNTLHQFLSNIEQLNAYIEMEKKKNEQAEIDMLDKENYSLEAWAINEKETLRRIFNSKTTRIDWYAFMASIHVDGEFVCAGAIIKKYFVITAATCLYTVIQVPQFDHVPRVTVRLGSELTSFDGAVVSITEIFIHPQFTPNTLRHNLAVLRMDNKIRTVKKIRKINKIAFSKDNGTLTNNVFILGWGAKNKENEQLKFQKLSCAYLEVFDLESCKNEYSRFYVTNYNFCAGSTNLGGGGACVKDGGDPAIVDGLLVGVVSFGSPKCGSPSPTVFTRISYYADWIERIVRLDMAKPAGKPTLPIPSMATTQYPLSLRNNAKQRVTPVVDYPEEMSILREILDDLAKTDGTVIDELIDESFDKEILHSMMYTTKTDLMHHPLINKSIVPVHGVHIPEVKQEEGEYHTVSLTTSKYFTYPWQNSGHVPIPDLELEYDEFADEYDHIITRKTVASFIPTISKRTTHTTEYTPFNPFSTASLDPYTAFTTTFRPVHRKAPEYDSSSSDDDSAVGLSIEVTTRKIFEDIGSLSREHATALDTNVFFYVDPSLIKEQQLGNNKHQVSKEPRESQTSSKWKKIKERKKTSKYRNPPRYTQMIPFDSMDYL